MKGKTALLLSVAVIAIALGFLVYTGLSQNMVYYFHVDEYLAKASTLKGEVVKVNGKVVEGSIHKQQMDYDFVIHGSPANTIRVAYHGVVPDTFKDNSDVVVEGTYDENAKQFHATTLMAKCPTKYEAQNTGKKMTQK
ncbi:MAG: cytochrome c biogenesis protein CcmE [Acidobacteria bacterium]|nr:MAG: cytochrome c biogenesis protein CcmE [Acidobacteriota bacterium]